MDVAAMWLLLIHDIRAAVTLHHFRNRRGLVHAVQDVVICHSHVSVDQHRLPAEPRQRDREVDADIGLADPALAAGDGNDAGVPVAPPTHAAVSSIGIDTAPPTTAITSTGLPSGISRKESRSEKRRVRREWDR